jgi:hypothetical protein
LPVVTMIDAESPHPGCRHRVFGESSAVVLADMLLCMPSSAGGCKG